MKKVIFITSDENEVRAAIFEKDVLEGLFIERKDFRRIAGSIYKGKVKRVIAGMEAAFVDIGLQKDGFLSTSNNLEEADPGQESASLPLRPLKRGDEILVQVTKEPIGTKGARLNPCVSLPGRFLVLMPASTHHGISQRITDIKERERLKKVLKEISPSGMGIIIRTTGAEATSRQLSSDLRYLLSTWKRIEKQNRLTKTPALIHEEIGLACRIMRDVATSEIDKVVVDNKKELHILKNFLRSLCPDLKVPLELYSGKAPLFEAHNIEEKIEASLACRVELPSGGDLVIEETEALTSIDVNTGKFTGAKGLEATATKVNLEAADEVARQLRLKDIGGIIIVDFIDMEQVKNQRMLLERFREALKRDKSKTEIFQLSPLGLVEVTRQRIRQNIQRVLLEKCPVCSGRGLVKSAQTVGIGIQRKLKGLAPGRRYYRGPRHKITVRTNTKVARRLLEKEREKISNIEAYLRKKIAIEADSNMHPEEFRIT